MSPRRSFALVSLTSSSMGLLIAAIAWQAGGCGESTDVIGNEWGVCSALADDGNPCTAETCEDAGVTHVPLNGSSCSLG
jgi:hypothetical protein